MDQKDVKDIKAKADGPGNLKSRRAMKDVKYMKAQKADGPRKMSKTSRLRLTGHERC